MLSQSEAKIHLEMVIAGICIIAAVLAHVAAFRSVRGRVH
jgi:hypothetical protein